MKKIITGNIIRPAGNDTALIEGIPSKKNRIKINNLIMQMYPHVEQVGFYENINNLARLEMAGGEFCGNALRSLAYLLLNGKKGRMKVKISGVDRILTAGIKKVNTAFAEMPIYSDFQSVEKLSNNLSKIQLSGIIHLITPLQQNGKNDIKTKAKQMLRDQKLLDTQPASGVMFYNQNKNEFSILPVVWVRDIETLFLETACASGTTALGLWYLKQSDQARIKLSVKQPSGENISIQVAKNDKSFLSAKIDGPIKIVNEFEIT